LKVALDTNIFIFFLEGVEPYASKVESILNSFARGVNEGVISTISIAEVLTGFYAAGYPEKATKTKEFLRDLTLTGVETVQVTLEIADIAAKLRARRGGRLPEALIVASAIDRGADLIYSQDEDLQRFSKDIKISKM